MKSIKIILNIVFSITTNDHRKNFAIFFFMMKGILRVVCLFHWMVGGNGLIWYYFLVFEGNLGKERIFFYQFSGSLSLGKA